MARSVPPLPDVPPPDAPSPFEDASSADTDDAAPLTEDYADQWAQSSTAPSSLKPLLKGLGLIVSLVVIGFAVKVLGVGDLLDTHWLDEQVIGKGIAGEALFIALGSLMCAVGVPRQIVAFGGGYAFGLVNGVLISMVAQVIGCAATFFYARLFGRSFVKGRFGARIRKVDDFLRGYPFSMTLLIRLLPLGSNLITNMAAGVTSVGAVPFLLGSLIGYLPQTVIFSLLGSGIHLDTVFRTALSIALFVISGLISVALYRQVRKKGREA